MNKEEILLEMIDIAINILVENEHCQLCAFRGSREDCYIGCDCYSGIFNGLEFTAKRNIQNQLDELGNRKAS